MAHDIAITQKMEIVEQIAKESKPPRTRKWNVSFFFFTLWHFQSSPPVMWKLAENEGVSNPHFVTKDLYSLVQNQPTNFALTQHL